VLLYLDSSALVKLLVSEPESRSLRRFIASWPDRVSSVVARVEVARAVGRRANDRRAAHRTDTLLDRVLLLHVDPEVLRVAARLEPPELRALDAIHLASALSLGAELGPLVTYDGRLAAAARRVRIEVAAPA